MTYHAHDQARFPLATVLLRIDATTGTHRARLIELVARECTRRGVSL